MTKTSKDEGEKANPGGAGDCLAELEAIDHVVFDAFHVAEDVEHLIACHTDSLPEVARKLAVALLAIDAAGAARKAALVEQVEGRRMLILDARPRVENSALFWRPGGAGYTFDLGQAGLYTFDDARSHRETDVPVPYQIARSVARLHVPSDLLREAWDISPSKR